MRKDIMRSEWHELSGGGAKTELWKLWLMWWGRIETFQGGMGQADGEVLNRGKA